MMEEAVDAMFRSGETREPLLVAMLKSERINRRHGGVLVTPWTLGDVPEDVLLMYDALFRVQDRAQVAQRREDLFRAFRQKHPTYRKYL